MGIIIVNKETFEHNRIANDYPPIVFGSHSKLHLVTDPENFCSDGEGENDDSNT